jgi:putative FmdB family regulatory protein
MPIYEFACASHGNFELERPMSEVRDPALCPECGDTGRRLLSAPNLATGSAVSRRIAGIHEQSQHEPRIVRREAPKPSSEAPARTLHHSHSAYPWALGH